jgi:hypothetical protein
MVTSRQGSSSISGWFRAASEWKPVPYTWMNIGVAVMVTLLGLTVVTVGVSSSE